MVHEPDTTVQLEHPQPTSEALMSYESVELSKHNGINGCETRTP